MDKNEVSELLFFFFFVVKLKYHCFKVVDNGQGEFSSGGIPNCCFIPASRGFPGGLVIKNLPANARNIRETSLIPGWGKSPEGRTWQPIPVFLSGEANRQRSLAGYSPQGHTKSDTTEAT